MTVNIRPAVKDDCIRMMELIRELALYERAPDEVTVELDHFINSGFGEKPVWWAYVADVTHADGTQRIEGFALYYIRYSTWKGQRMYLEDIIVTELMRGKGIGRLLFQQLQEVCRDKNFKGMTWQVLEWNEPAINFYHKFEGVHLDPEWINGSWIP